MKKFIIVFVALLPLISYSQVGTTKECTSCINNKVDLPKGASALGTANNSEGINSFAVGYSNIASGDYSMALGNDVLASGENSIAMGYKSQAVGDVSVSIGLHAYTTTNALMSLAIGSRVTSSVEKAMTIGNGLYENPITNNIENSLMIGFNSNLHTFFVSESSGQNTTGKIGIGNVTDPQAKLHIKGDSGEEASIMLEAVSSQNTSIYFGSTNKYIRANQALAGITFHGGDFFFENGDASFTQNVTVTGNIDFQGDLLHNGNPFETSKWEENGDDIYYDGGKVGIGTNNPQATLDVYNSLCAGNSSSNHAIYMGSVYDNGGMDWSTAYIGFNVKREGANDWITKAENSNGGAVIYSKHNGDLVFSSLESTGSVGQTLVDADIKAKAKMILLHDGLLKVKEVKVKTDVWSDYVFYDDYQLRPLEEVEAFIKENKHLPEVPTASEIIKEGINLGETDVLLLKKIEELTLYIIDLKKENEKVNQRINLLEK